jgi:F0F1-type ATP synthase epsilon subunit
MATHLDIIKKDSATRTAPKDKLNVLIYTPFKTYFDGFADSVTAKNNKGVFDVLPQHHNFITLLDPGDITVINQNNTQKVKIDRGLMLVNSNVVTVFLDV